MYTSDTFVNINMTVPSAPQTANKSANIFSNELSQMVVNRA